MLNIPECRSAGKVFQFFEEFSKIPHGSMNTSKIADYLCNFAKERNLQYRRDEADNVIIKKPATKGYENRPTVIFQGHLDMVEAQTPDCKKDMKKEGLDLYRDGDFIRAKGTTLGADDGVALAYCLAILDSDDIAHPDFEAVITANEEIGLLGAVALDTSDLKGKILVNIDSDDEGVFTVGCAGGMRSDLKLPVRREKFDGKSYKLSAGGFLGGHSGVEIDKGRINALKATVEVLNNLENIRISKIEGGNADNAIPRECECLFVSDIDPRVKFSAICDEIKKRYFDIEPDINFTLCEVNDSTIPLTEENSNSLLEMLSEIPTGVIAMSEDIKGLVQTSLNLGILKLEENECNISLSVRSAKGVEKRELGDNLKNIAKKFGASYAERGDYPAWEYKKDSHIRDVMIDVFEKMYKKSPVVMTIHAGLECGIFAGKIENLDCISLGPDNFDIHTTEEHLSIPSTVRVWEFLIEVLKNI